MTRCYCVIRGGPAAAMLAAALAAVPAGAIAAARHHFEIMGNLSPVAPSAQSATDTALKARFGASIDPVMQSGAGFVLSAKLAVSPLACYGDTIFRDGFDP